MELARSTSRGGFSVRSILTFVLSVILTALISATLLSATTSAAPGDAVWKGDSIMYDGHQYYSAGEAKTGETHGLTVGSHYYLHIETISERPLERKAHVIYFAPGSDPPTAVTAEYAVYDYPASKEFSNPQERQSIGIEPAGTSNETATSCAIEGVGWIVCALSTWLATGMDTIFNVLAGFIAVQPPQAANMQNDLYVAWNIMRSFANIAFIIVFIIIIYSQLTGLGLNNYGLKKLIPRLIIAAILVNLSYYICAIAIDISNILGYSLQDIFIQIRQNTFNIDNDTWAADVLNWQSITEFVLSGGTATAAAGVGIAGGILAFLGTGVSGSVVSLIFLILPALLALLLTVLVVLVILAARQAIIVLLLIIAPLAFVAYLLPNTEKWFEKWRELFMTMLIFFPAFSIVFGGSQLAGGLIIQNANSITVMILGMIVQVAPLVITPLILKLSGNLLGRIGALVNDPKKGILDRTRNWAKANADYHAARVRNGYRLNGKPLNPNNPGALRGRNFIRRGARGVNHMNRRLEDKTKNMNALGDNLYHGSSPYEKLHTEAHGFEMDKTIIDNRLNTHVQREINSTGSALHVKNVRLEDGKLDLEVATARTARQIEEYKSGRLVRTGELDELMRNMKQNTIQLAAEKQGAQASQYTQQKNISSAFTAQDMAAQALLRTAASVDPNGRVRALANAEAALAKLEKEALENSVQLLNVEAIRLNRTLKSHSLSVIETEMTTQGSYEPQVIEAALEAAAQDGQVSILRQARMSSNIDQTVLTKLFARNASTMKAKGGFDLQADPSLAGATPQVMNASIANTIGDVTADHIADVKAGFWGDVAGNITAIISDSNTLGGTPELDARAAGARAGLKKTYLTLTEALRNDDIRATLGDRLEETMRIHEALHNEFNDPSKQIDYDQYR